MGCCLGIVAADEIDTAFHERGDEGDVAPETVKLGDEKGCPLLLALLKRGEELRAILMALAAFDFGVLGKKRALMISPARTLSVMPGTMSTWQPRKLR